MQRPFMVFVAMFALLWGTVARPGEHEEHQVYTRVHLVSDMAGVARFPDSHLVNPWGLGFGPRSPFWIADNNGGVSTLDNGFCHRLGAPTKKRPHDQPNSPSSRLLLMHGVGLAPLHASWCPHGT